MTPLEKLLDSEEIIKKEISRLLLESFLRNEQSFVTRQRWGGILNFKGEQKEEEERKNPIFQIFVTDFKRFMNF